MLRMYCLQQCHGLTDEALQDAPYDSQALRDFVGVALSRESVLDATTLLKPRRLLNDDDLTRAMFECTRVPDPRLPQPHIQGHHSGNETAQERSDVRGIEDMCGVKVARIEQRIDASSVTTSDATPLLCPVGSPVMRIQRM